MATSPWIDEPCVLPPDWSALPVVGHFDQSRAVASDRTDLLFTARVTMKAQVALHVWVEARSTVCTAGGSACQSSPSELDDVRVGDLDARGVPEIGAPFTCEGSCSIEKLTLRGRSDGKLFVLTMQEPSGEKPIVAFTRAPRPPPRLLEKARESSRENAAALVIVLAAFVVVVTAALVVRRRLRGTR